MELHMHSHRFARRRPDWCAAAFAGLAAGVIFLVLEVAVTVIQGGSLWAPVRMTAAIVMGHNVLTNEVGFEAGVMLAGLVVHFALSAILGLILAAIMASFSFDSSFGVATLAGVIFGLVVYWFDFYGMTRVFPWFADARSAASLGTHLVFGLVAADTYWRFKGKVDIGAATAR
ncbi:hypothetical protein [Cupriavidus pinatubonensis]|uniref:Transmembrane protein n=1 Tax=Cupriavidus pinatubonensis TaxID=248026 RepID=A0ABM8XKQ2_9BURK|nr:hypothetical protein [Cupriavidus pinatubonensis]CAG9180791.1 hypothetical protein LMG23994_04494 [Cupriavidus pinatubonensis]